MAVVLNLVGGLAAGLLIALAAGYYQFVLQKLRFELGWEVISSTLIVTSPALADIKVVVSPHLLSGEGRPHYLVKNEAGTPEAGWTEIQEFRSYLIRVRNTGNRVIRSQLVSFVLEKDARTVSLAVESQPQLGGQTIVTALQTPSPNIASANLPFLNPRDEVVFSMQAVNTTSPGCDVQAGAPALKFFNLALRREPRSIVLMLPLAISFGVPLFVLMTLEALGDGPHILDHQSHNTAWNYIATVSLAGMVLFALEVIVKASRFESRRRPRRARV